MDSKIELPPITQQPVMHLDGTPDAHYPIRILKAYRENCNCLWDANPPQKIYDMMNEHQAERAAILDKAIAILERELFKEEEDG